MSDFIVYHQYPIIESFYLGCTQESEVDIAPDIPLLVIAIDCNIPAPNMVIISESPIFYRHDPWNIGVMPGGLPIKQRELTIQKKWLKKLHVKYSGYVPPGYRAGAEFLMQYRFRGIRIEE